MTNVVTECDRSLCPDRRRRFEVELGYEIGRKISKLHDRKRILFVDWIERPSAQDIAAVTNAWRPDTSDPITYHYENGVELVGCVPRYNPFGGGDQNHLAAIEHLRTARDLLKKSTKRMKQNGTEPNSLKRVFQAIKLTESALRRELLLLQIPRHRCAQIGGIISNPPKFPFAELLGRGQIDVQEVRIAPVGWELDRYRARRELRSAGDVIPINPPDRVGRQVPAIARVAQRKTLVEIICAPRDGLLTSQYIPTR